MLFLPYIGPKDHQGILLLLFLHQISDIDSISNLKIFDV